MKFRFCGDGDCPDWVLTEIPTLTKLTSIKMKLLCGLVAKSLSGDELDLDRAKGLTSDAKFSDADVHGAIAALRWLLGAASRHGVDADPFSSELQQIGLPREHAQAAAKVFGEHVGSITSHLRAQSLRVSILEDASCCALPVTGLADDAPSRRFLLTLAVWDAVSGCTRNHKLSLSLSQLQELLSDLQRARTVMESS